jgi:Reverse transcriptase (RNA-dependent DNA polymerase)
LYGLKQAPRAWYAKLTDFLREIGFRSSIADPNLWIGMHNGAKVFIVIVVDDTLITSADEQASQSVVHSILQKFPGKSSDATWYCGMKLNWQHDGSVILTQKSHIEQIVDRYNLHDCLCDLCH